MAHFKTHFQMFIGILLHQAKHDTALAELLRYHFIVPTDSDLKINNFLLLEMYLKDITMYEPMDLYRYCRENLLRINSNLPSSK